jgi:hypothetical protein
VCFGIIILSLFLLKSTINSNNGILFKKEYSNNSWGNESKDFYIYKDGTIKEYNNGITKKQAKISKDELKKLKDLAIAAGIAMESDSKEEAANNFIKAIRQMNKEMGIPEKLKGIKADDIKIMAKHAAQEANPLYPVPKLMNAKQLEKFYYNVMEEN